MSHNHHRLGVASLGLAAGITWAIGLLVLGWVSWWSGWGAQMVAVIGSVYVGYQPTFWGTIIGAIWGFVDLFIAGVIFAAIYNCCSCGKKCGTGESMGGSAV